MSSPKSRQDFNGFSQESLDFLRNLKANNNRAWFKSHRQDYMDHLLTPMRHLVADIGTFMLAIDPYLEVMPAIDRTISRIYRDTRFSRDKSPYKSSMWITFKRPSKDWKDKIRRMEEVWEKI